MMLKIIVGVPVFIVMSFLPQTLLAGENHPARTPILLTAVERDAVLTEMRDFLHNTQRIITALSVSDMQQVAVSARKSGRGAGAAMPGTLRAKLPKGFKKLGSDTHRRFDEMALDAEQLGDEAHALEQLGVLLGNCVSCHAAYRFELE